MADSRIAYFTVNSGSLADPAGDFADRRFHVCTLRGQETISQLFSFELKLVAKEDPISPVEVQDLISEGVTISLRTSDAGTAGDVADDTYRPINGIVSRASHSWTAGAEGDEAKYSAYLVTVVPLAWNLTKNFQSRVFQDKTVKEIVKLVVPGTLDDTGLGDAAAQAGGGEGGAAADAGDEEKRDHCIQYRETDMNFVSRLLEQEGISFYFRHTATDHELVLSDGFKGWADCGSTDEITKLFEHQEIQSDLYVGEDFNFKDADHELMGDEQTPEAQVFGAAGRRVYDYPIGFGTLDRFNSQRAKDVAGIRLQEKESRAHVFTGTSRCLRFCAGGTFSLVDDRPGSSWSGKTLLLTSVQHRLEQPPPYPTKKTVGTHYTNLIASIPFGANGRSVYRPPLISPKPVVNGPQSAIVQPLAGSSATSGPDPDPDSRVCVLFHWDQFDSSDDIKTNDHSCLVRVSQPWAGVRPRGAISIPQIGEEVVVSFLEGDPDRPVITGRLYNSTALPTKELPTHKMKTIFDDGGGNKIIMDADSANQSIKLISAGKLDGGEDEAAASSIQLGPDGGVSTKSTSSKIEDWSGTKIEAGFGHKWEFLAGHKLEARAGIMHSIALSADTNILVGPKIDLHLGPAFNWQLGPDIELSTGSRSSESRVDNLLLAKGIANIVGGNGGASESIIHASSEQLVLSVGTNVDPPNYNSDTAITIAAGAVSATSGVVALVMGGLVAGLWEEKKITKNVLQGVEATLDVLAVLAMVVAGFIVDRNPKIHSHDDAQVGGDDPNSVIRMTQTGEVEATGEKHVIIGTPKSTQESKRSDPANLRAQIKLKESDIHLNREGEKIETTRVRLSDAGLILKSVNAAQLVAKENVEVTSQSGNVEIKGKSVFVNGKNLVVAQ